MLLPLWKAVGSPIHRMNMLYQPSRSWCRDLSSYIGPSFDDISYTASRGLPRYLEYGDRGPLELKEPSTRGKIMVWELLSTAISIVTLNMHGALIIQGHAQAADMISGL